MPLGVAIAAGKEVSQIATKLTTRCDQIAAELDKAKAEFSRSPGSRDLAKAIGHLRTVQAMTRKVKDFIQGQVVETNRSTKV